MKHYYENVPRLGNVAVSRHANRKCSTQVFRKRHSTAPCSILPSRTLPMGRISSGESATGYGWSSSRTRRRTVGLSSSRPCTGSRLRRRPSRAGTGRCIVAQHGLARLQLARQRLIQALLARPLVTHFPGGLRRLLPCPFRRQCHRSSGPESSFSICASPFSRALASVG